MAAGNRGRYRPVRVALRRRQGWSVGCRLPCADRAGKGSQLLAVIWSSMVTHRQTCLSGIGRRRGRNWVAWWRTRVLGGEVHARPASLPLRTCSHEAAGEPVARAAGTARYAYNWGLSRIRGLLGKSLPVPSAPELHRMWNAYKRENAPWWVEVSKAAPQEALRDLRRAFDNFFASKQGKRKGAKVRFPHYHKKGRNDAFRLTGSIRVGRRAVKLPRIGWVRTKEETAEVPRARAVSHRAARGRPLVRVAGVEVERPDPRPASGGPVVGVDLGLKAFAVLSDGTRSSRRPRRSAVRSVRFGVEARHTAARRRARSDGASRPWPWPGCTGG